MGLYTGVQVPREVRGIRSPGIGVISTCGLPDVVTEKHKSGSLKEQDLLLTTASFLPELCF